LALPEVSHAEPLALADKVDALSRARTYGLGQGKVSVVETHNSVVFLTGDRAYKLKKPVRRPYLDHTGLDARRTDALEELRVNRRLAPDVYLGVVALRLGERGQPVLEGHGEIVDWLVEMRRLPPRKMLDARIADHRAGDAALRRVARLIAAFHRNQPPAMVEPAVHFARLAAAVRENREVLSRPGFGIDVEQAGRVHDAQAFFLADAADLIAARAALIVDGHGDLKPEHILVEPALRVLDAITYDREERLIDPADDVVRLGVECERRGFSGAVPLLAEAHGAVLGERTPPRLAAFLASRHASTRARLALWHLEDAVTGEARARWVGMARAWLDLAEAHAADL
jgi:aminoglycoside phosphotransferase family enzyme